MELSGQASTDHQATNYDTKLWVFEGECDQLNCLTDNDDGVADSLSFVSFQTQIGHEYFVVVGGNMGSGRKLWPCPIFLYI